MGALIKFLISFGPQIYELLQKMQLFKPKAKPQYQKMPEPVEPPKTAGEMVERKEQVLKQKDLISFEDYVTASGKYPDRLNSPELTEEVKKNARVLLKKINSMLVELGVTSVRVSSGFRPAAANAKAGGAKKSAHMTGAAIDLVDLDGKLDQLFESRDDLLKKYGLWLESPAHTKGWAHCDTKDRGKRAKNIFIP